MNHGHSSSIDAVVALERSGALLADPSTSVALAAAIASVRSLHELESIVKRVQVWTEGELPLRGPALSALIAKATEFTTPAERAQVWLWVATTVYSTPDAMFGAPGRPRIVADEDVQDALRIIAPTLVRALADPFPKLACAACAVLLRLECHSRETMEAILDAASCPNSDDVSTGIALVVGVALAHERLDADQAAAANQRLREEMASASRQIQCMASVVSVLADPGIEERAAGILCDALTMPLQVTGVLGWGANGDQLFSTAHYAALALRWANVPEAFRGALANALLRWPGGELRAEALRAVAFAQGDVPSSGLVRDSLNAEQQLALRQIALDGSLDLLASLGFGPERDDIAAFLQGEDLPWRPVVDLNGNISGHYLKVARAVAEGELSPTRSANAWLDCTGATHAALDCCLNDYWFVEQLSEVEWVNHLEFVLAIVDEVSRRGLPVRRLLEQAFEDGNSYDSALLASALARVYEEAAAPWPPELDALLSDAVTSAKVADPLRQALEQLPLPRLEAVLATFPALPFWDMCLTAPVVREMLEFVRLFPEHYQDVVHCFRRGELRVARESLMALRSKHEVIVDKLLVDIGEI